MSGLQNIRPAAVAGQFYSADAFDLADTVLTCLGEADNATSPRPKAIIAPHAGYVYSGQTAGAVYRTLLPLADQITRVVLIGPSHRVALSGLATSSADGFATPLGIIPLDQEAIATILDLPQVQVMDAAHAQEHSLEVQLPFLQSVLTDFSLVPIVAGNVGAEEVSEVLDRLWGGAETLIVISSDLSHYLDYESAVSIDTETSLAIESLSTAPLSGEQACGCIGINGLLHQARAHAMRVTRIDLRNSGDTAGSKDRVVGYGAWIFSEAPPDVPEQLLSNAEQARLREIARLSIQYGLEHGKALQIEVQGMTEALQTEGACFVTLTIDGKLRGCIGSLEAVRPLAQDIAHNAWSAACKDPRFSPLRPEELAAIDMHISVLTPLTPISFSTEDELVELLQPMIDGLVIRQAGKRATYLPSVWASIPDPRTFLDQLKLKADIASGESGTLEAWRYTTEQF